MQDKCRKNQRANLCIFIDLVKAFDSANREALWRISELDGCPPKFINIIRPLRNNMNAIVLTNHGPGEALKITTGVKQGCVIEPTLFSMFLGTVLHIVRENLPPSVEVTHYGPVVSCLTLIDYEPRPRY